jgi:hypothetical protein
LLPSCFYLIMLDGVDLPPKSATTLRQGRRRPYARDGVDPTPEKAYCHTRIRRAALTFLKSHLLSSFSPSVLSLVLLRDFFSSPFLSFFLFPSHLLSFFLSSFLSYVLSVSLSSFLNCFLSVPIL